MLGVIYIQVSILTKCYSKKYRYFKKNFRTSFDTSKKNVRTVSILHKFCSNSIDTSKLMFEHVSILQKKFSNSSDTSKLVFEHVSILQKVSSFTALKYTNMYIYIYI